MNVYIDNTANIYLTIFQGSHQSKPAQTRDLPLAFPQVTGSKVVPSDHPSLELMQTLLLHLNCAKGSRIKCH